jgi:hypothetical protein
MASLVKHPFTDQDYTKINKELARQEQLRQLLEMGKEAGFPCEDGDEMCRQVREQLIKIKKVFFPDRP